MQRLPTPDEPAFGDDLPWLEAGVAYVVSGAVSDEPIEEQHLGAGAQAPTRRAARAAGRALQGDVVMDDAYLGGERRGKAGRGSENKVSFVAAVQLSEEGHPQIARFDPVKGFTRDAIGQWAERYLCTATRVLSDGLNCFPAVAQAGAVHVPEVVGGSRRSTDMPCFTWVNTLLGNLKTALAGTYHAFNFRKYAHRYLAEYQYRFNRRFDLKAILPRLVRAAAATGPRTEAWLRTAEQSC